MGAEQKVMVIQSQLGIVPYFCSHCFHPPICMCKEQREGCFHLHLSTIIVLLMSEIPPKVKQIGDFRGDISQEEFQLRRLLCLLFLGCCNCCCFLLCFWPLGILILRRWAAWELLKENIYFWLFLSFRSKRAYNLSNMEVKRGVQRYDPPGLRYMGKLLFPPFPLSHHPSELRSIQVSWLQIWLVSGETMLLF